MSEYKITHFVRYTDLNGASFIVGVMADSPEEAATRATKYGPTMFPTIEVWEAGTGPVKFEPHWTQE